MCVCVQVFDRLKKKEYIYIIYVCVYIPTQGLKKKSHIDVAYSLFRFCFLVSRTLQNKNVDVV